MQGRCEKHLFEAAEDTCGKCGHDFCGECLVYAFGPKKPPLCIPCAVAAAGIRANAGNRPAAPTKDLKRMQKERVSAFRRFQRRPVDEPAAEMPVQTGPQPGFDPALDLPAPQPIAPAVSQTTI